MIYSIDFVLHGAIALHASSDTEARARALTLLAQLDITGEHNLVEFTPGAVTLGHSFDEQGRLSGPAAEVSTVQFAPGQRVIYTQDGQESVRRIEYITRTGQIILKDTPHVRFRADGSAMNNLGRQAIIPISAATKGEHHEQ